jgi:DNA-binding CsgD family transcriptional regulator
MNPHLIFLLYLVAAISGILSLAYFFKAFLRGFSDVIRSYLLFIASYSLMIVSSTIFVYAGINIMPAFPSSFMEAGIILGACCMAYTFPAFIHRAINRPFPHPRKIIFGLFAWSAVALAPLSFSLAKTKFAPLPSAASILFFGMSFIYVLFLLARNHAFSASKTSRRWRIIMGGFVAGSIGLALVETVWLTGVSFNRGYVLSLPSIYLMWNILSYFLIGKSLVGSDPGLGFTVDENFSSRYNLTDREKVIAAHITEGKFNKEIADTLHISPNTVKNHIYNLFKKVGVQSRMEFLRKLQRK